MSYCLAFGIFSTVMLVCDRLVCSATLLRAYIKL